MNKNRYWIVSLGTMAMFFYSFYRSDIKGMLFAIFILAEEGFTAVIYSQKDS